MRTGSEAMAPSSAARCEIDLSAGGVSSPRRAGAGGKRTFMPIGPGRRAARPRARRGPRAPIGPGRPVAMSGDGASDMSAMLMPACESVSATSAMTPGRLGTTTASSASSSPAVAASSASRPAAARSCQARRSLSGGQPVANVAQLADRGVELGDQRVAVGRVDTGPQLGVGARDACGVAEARADVRPSAHGLVAQGDGCAADQQVGQRVRQVRDRRHHAVVGLRFDHRRPGAQVGQQPVQALESHSRGLPGRSQIPGRTVEEILAGGAGAARLRAGQRVPADEPLVVDGGYRPRA